MTTTASRRSAVEPKGNGHIGTSVDSSRLLTIEVPSETPSTSTSVEPSPAGEAPTLTPISDGEKKRTDSNGNVPCERPKKAPRRAPRPTGEEDNGPRKSNRVTRNRDDPSSVVNNYVDSNDLKRPRRVQPPIGATRIPFILPKLDLEKEKDKLKIHMVGPKNRRKDEGPQSGTKYMTDVNRQADFSPYLSADFCAPSCATEPDRDELMWADDGRLEFQTDQMDQAWNAIRRQFNGTISLDAVMRRLMQCDYNVEKMMSEIELEQFERLAQPFEPLSFGQQAEFQRLLRKSGNPTGKHRGGEKIFRMFQEKFLKNYYSGEIINYYYNTKRKGCQHSLYTRCTCLENLTNESPASPRSLCFNCTKYLHEEFGAPKSQMSRCTVCETFKRIYGTERSPTAALFPKDEEFAKRWLECEKIMGGTKMETAKKVKEEMEKERRKIVAQMGTEEVPPIYHNGRLVKLTFDQICKKSQKFQPHQTHRCSLSRPWGNKLLEKELQRFKPAECLEMVKAFQQFGLNFHRVAVAVKRKEEEISLFYNLYRNKYRIDEIADKSVLKKSAKRSSNYNSSIQRISQEDDRSDTQTPEPKQNSRRKRAASLDPPYCEKTQLPMGKVRRRTRQSAADEIKEQFTDGAHNPTS